ncbi:hypothetical protein PYCCODRAFT_1377310 [Trametes coccinea BRFM310]|uniref:Uncharacterized protein n=1 Tax=Trametes coccinea (strain BRFM310) TaxID=1353009 RepID=A0A1Y2I8F4_TRAC3|nr:hypothetical protein PYCCODRAFT_1378887 [Trametes coccinea BRFM310]OSC97405.1 hypothetical protein PYCCODRAFT_1377310 [Trametes coccinea BRFM310]
MPRSGRLRDALGVHYATRIGRERGMLRTVITDGLVAITSDPRATMHWTRWTFFRFVFLAYGVKLVGWPQEIPFVNLSHKSMTSTNIRALLDAWASGQMRWVEATPRELLAADHDSRNACPGPRFRVQAPHPPGGRNDIGKRRERPTIDSAKFPPRYVRDGPKSRRYIDSDEEKDDIEDADDWGAVSGQRVGLARGEPAEDPIESFSDDD